MRGAGMGRRLVVCCDGTWNRWEGRNDTNVEIACRTVVEDGFCGQLVRYFEGVGASGCWLQRFAEGAFGWGLNRNILIAYRWLATTYRSGDAIYVFGFSRGAYTARSLIGLIRNAGLLKPETLARADEAMALYRDRARGPDHPDAQLFRRRYAVAEEPPEIAYLGVWDTVGALGVPATFPGSRLINRRHRFHDTELSRIVRRARHAVAVDELVQLGAGRRLLLGLFLLRSPVPRSASQLPP